MTNVHTNRTNANRTAAGSSLRLKLDDESRAGARIKVIGVGGGGGNAVNRMVKSGLQGVDFIVANTDIQALQANGAPSKIQLGVKLTKGLGAGADPNLGRQAAMENTNEIIDALDGADMVFVTTGLGGGTGTGAAPVIANLASELGSLTVAVVTKPFNFEGKQRATRAEEGLDKLRDSVDSVITIPNERLLLTKSTTFRKAFEKVDDVLLQAVQGISDLILAPGIINLDFADVRTIMSRTGMAIMGTGVGKGANRASAAANRAISSPLLEDAAVEGARGVIINVTGGNDLSIGEVNEASSIIHEAAHDDVNIIFGAVIDPRMQGQVKITVIATGFDKHANAAVEPVSTPVDLQQYSSLQQASHEPAAEAPRLSLAMSAEPDLSIVSTPTHVITQSSQIDQSEQGADDLLF
ncbi:MAG TPA: cell division protein FtsZ, partial [Acidobacteria bacterium]|nr:cell division protein FtsZ [Acidobacteriota bacterium]